MKSPLVSIVIVSRNGKDYLAVCLASLKQQSFADYEVILIDNDSNDGSLGMIDDHFADFVKVIKTEHDYGFAKANNIGIASSRAKYIVLLNNDAKADINWLNELIKPAERDDQIGMCASKILFMHNPKLIDSTGLGIYPDGTSKQRGWLEEDGGQYDDKVDILLPSGCAALYRREMLEQIGCFDERYFAYCEDTDLGLRAQFAGWKCRFVPQAVVYHYYSGSWKNFPLKKVLLIERNRILLIFKLFPLWAILKSYYYYLVRCIYSIYGTIYHQGIVSDYLAKIFLWELIFVIFRAHVGAISLLPSLLLERIRTRNKLVQKVKIHSLLKKYAISVQEIALRG